MAIDYVKFAIGKQQIFVLKRREGFKKNHFEPSRLFSTKKSVGFSELGMITWHDLESGICLWNFGDICHNLVLSQQDTHAYNKFDKCVR